MDAQDIELLYELSPLQQAMLFHSLYAPDSGVYVMQESLRLSGPLDVSAFHRAWKYLVARHGILRTAFYWEELEKPLQVVYREVLLPFACESWLGLEAGEQRDRLARYLAEDLARGFELGSPPLLRLALFELSPGVHQLVWTQHHILIDGWSRGLLLKELFTCYRAFVEGREPDLGRAGSYHDYIQWLQGQDPGEAEAYWRRSLQGFSSPTSPVGGAGRQTAATDFRRSGQEDLRLSAAATEELRALARRHRLTLNTLVQGAWALLLARFLGVEEVVFGTTLAGRPAGLPGVESTVGLFINTLPLRVAVAPDRRLIPWLQELQEKNVELRRHEHTPLLDVQRWSELPAGIGLFDHLLAFENVPLDRELSRLVPDLAVSDLVATSLTNYPLNLIVFPGTELWLEILYDRERISPAETARLLARWAGLLATFAKDPDLPLSRLPLLLPGERQQVVVEWNDTWSDYPRERSVHELFAACAAARPEASAVVGTGEEWSYGRLDAASNRLARHLRSLGVGPESRVGISMERSAELVVGVLAILKAGGAYVPLDAGYPDERLAFMVEDTGASVVLVHDRTRERLEQLELPEGAARPLLLCLERDREEIAGRSATALPSVTAAAHLAYVIYTSGSTGRPKGVAVEHGAIVRLVRGTNYAQLGPEDRVGHVSNISFDAATFELWGALLNGGSLVVIAREVVLSPERFVARLQAERVTAMFLTAALFNQVVRELPAGFSSMRHLLVGGEALDAVSVGRALSAGSPARLLNGYGPTESTTFAVWHEVRELSAGETSVPIGMPLANTTAYVLERSLEPAALGQVGELYLGGEGLARGYLNRPELTAERFVPSPWSFGGRLYRTGDLSRRRPDGAIEYLGRLDHQVKIRGFRIEPGEIEAVLAGCPGVGECAVLARRDTPGDARLVAYVVASPGTSPSAGELRDYLSRSLPEYMVPSFYLFLQSLPLTSNGKLDRGALPAPEAVEKGEEEPGALSPRSPSEDLLAGIWEEVLGLTQVGVEEDFFALGGHSLLATKVASRVRQTFGVDLPLQELFERPTIAILAAELDRRLGGSAAAEAPPILPLARTGELALSFAQQRLWILDQLQPGNAVYNIPWAMRLSGPLAVEPLRHTLEEVVRRHEVLRTTFSTSPATGEPVQRIRESRPLDLPTVSLSGLAEERREAEARRLAAAEALRPFDLRSGPLLRVLLLGLAEREHVLLVTIHHIAADGWSVGVLEREVVALYGAFSRGERSPLAELPIQYADFAAWQRSWLDGEILEGQLAYWRQQLAGVSTRLELPADRPRPVTPSLRGGLRPVALSGGLSRDLAVLCRQEGVTPFMALLAAFGVLLGRLSGQAEVTIGSPIANRTQREIEGLIGFFVNTLVLRVDLAEEPSFREVLGRVRKTALGAYTHQDLPFERLVEELGADRGAHGSPLFQVMFALQNARAEALELPGLTLRLLPLAGGVSRFDLTLMLHETGAGLAGLLEYSADLFDRATAERLLARFEGLLESALLDPELAVRDVPLLLPGERQQVFLEWNDTWSEYPRERSVHELFAACAAARPEAPAVVGTGEEWSYGRLDEASNRLARHLRSLGVGPESRVGISMERSAELVVGVLAILKAGGAYVPLDAGYPDERLSFMVEDTGAAVVLVHDRTRERLEHLDLPEGAARPRLVCLERDREAIAGRSATALPSVTSPSHLAYVIYTSGSTGRPKGVAVEHGAIVRLVRGTNYAQLGPEDRVGHVSNISFDAATFELWGALLNGGSLVVISREVVLSPEALVARLESERVTAMFLTAALFNQVVRELPAGFSSMRHLLVGGEALDVVSVHRALSAGGPARLLNGYGPTESTTFAVWHEVRNLSAGETSVPIGLPLANTTAYVLDRGLEPAVLGQVGELYLGGEGLARGYLNRPELTAERFVPSPWSFGGRLYRTGDLSRRRPDGAIEYLGRLDHQVKIRGFRIEPGEIEAVLAGCPGVGECAVLARRDTPGDARLVAYVVASPGASPSAGEVRDYLSRTLPEYMVPSFYLFLPSLPLTSNGKLDRGALPSPEEMGKGAEEPEALSLRSPSEDLLAGIWEEVLGLECVGVEEDFFALGGHSLLATKVASRMRQTFGVDLPLLELFERPTIASLAAELDRRLGGSATAEAPPILPVARTGELALSFAQQRLWFLDQLQPGNPAYHVPWAVRLSGPLAVEPLRQTLEEVVRRHEVLRTTFAVSPRTGGPVQRIVESRPLRLPTVSLAGLPEDRRKAEADRLAAAAALRPFDLRSGPLLRVLLLGLSEQEHVLLVTIHHIAADGWSVGVLEREVVALYGAFSRGEASPLAELPIQYADFAAWQRSWLAGEVLEGQLAFWRRQLAGVPTRLELPTDRRPVSLSSRGDLQPVSLSEDLSRDLAALCRQEGVTPFMALLAAFGVLLGRLSGQEQIAIGSPIANRTRRELEGLIGFFVNTLVLPVDLSGGPSFREVLERVRRAALGAYTHQDLPFEKLADELVPDRGAAPSPLFQVMFAFQNAAAASLALPGLATEVVELPLLASKFDLTLALSATGDRLAGGVEYRTDLFDRTTVERLTARLKTLLHGIVAGPELPVADLPLLPAGERRQLLDWSVPRSRPAEPPRESLADLFAARARQTPGARAVTCEGEELTYGELDRRANQLAHRLRELGVGPEERVGLSVERSLDLVVGVLGILKAGGAYVPLDPGYPQERLLFLTADAGARVLVGTAPALAGLPHSGPAVLLDAEAEALARYPTDAPAPLADGGSLAYVIYTSGSTGKPKGVLVTHANVIRLFRATEPWFGFGPDDIWTLFHSYAFDFSVWEIWGALLYGGRLVVVPYAVSRAPEAFHDLLSAEGVTVLNQTPSAFSQLARADEDPARAGALPGLRLVIFGGEALEPARLAPWFARHGDRQPLLVNMYGITETTVHVTCRPLRREDAQAGRGSVIGVPIPDLGLSVHDPGFGLAPLGVPGELAVGGAGLARGYLGRPELTAERFVPDPVSGVPGARLYRSGDLGRFLPGGDIEYLGRIDHQIKIRGFRIELDEIQVALLAQPGVREAIVLPRDEGDGERRLIAYVVPRPERRPEATALREGLVRRLPEHMVPAAFVLLDALPLTENGKVDRKALLAQKTFHREESTAYQPPGSEAEAALVEIFEQVLGLDRVGIDDRFFSLGGDSILSLRVRTLAEERGLHFSLQELLEHQTVRGLASHLEPGREELPAATVPFGLLAARDREALPAGLEDAYPLTTLQTGMLFHSGYTAESTLYHNVTSLKLTGVVDIPALREAVAELLARHPVLCTSFDFQRFGEPLQLVHRRVESPLAVADLRGLSTEEQDRLLAVSFERERERKFDVSTAPLLRLRIHLLEEEVFQLTLTEHHAILDGWSVATLLTELFQLYRSRRATDPSPASAPAAPAATFRDFVALERRALASDEARRYWERQLADAQPTSLSGWRPETGDPVPGPRIREISLTVEPGLTTLLKRLAAASGTPLKSVLLAAHFRVLAAATGETDLLSGVVFNGRPEAQDGERALGLFLNTLPLRLRLAGGTWRDLIRQTTEAEREAFPVRRYPMAEIQRSRGGGPLFETAFNFIHFHVLRAVEGGGTRVLAYRAAADIELPMSTTFALDLASSRIALNLQFDEAVLTAPQAGEIGGLYLRVLAAMAADPEARHDAQSFLGEAARHQILREWNDTLAPIPDLSLSELFASQAEARPDAVAVDSRGGALTYGELSRRANRLGHHLRSLGVGPEVPVGLLLDRSLDLVVGLFGILAAGGAYVPLDPAYPAERLVFILEDSGARALVTRSGAERSLGEVAIPVVRLDLDGEALARRSSTLPQSGVTADHLAYVIYTSGSTGKPKGVLVRQAAVVNYAVASARYYGLTPADRGLQFTSINFDASVEEVFARLLHGATLVLRDEAMLDSPRRFLDTLAEQAVTSLTLPTAYWHELAAALADPGVRLPASLRVVDVGGEKALAEPVARWQRARPRAESALVNVYGPTETTVACALLRLPPAVGREVPVGRPITNTRLYLLGPDHLPVATGAVGALFVGGEGVARGYLGRPDLTAESFVPDPFSGLPGERMYRTGDLAVHRPDGTLRFRGRGDDQVKIRGFRLELGEIESAVARHPAVSEAAVVVRQDPTGERALVAYAAVAGEPRPRAAEIRRFLREELPAYMMPAAFVLLDRLPRTANGKVDRRALPAPEWTRESLSRDYVPPRDALERQLVEIWEDLLGLRPLGVADDFFDLGGHSLLAVQLVARIESQLGQSVATATLLRETTVERLAAHLREEAGPARRAALVEIEPGEPGSGRPFFCVHPIGGDVLCYVHLARQLAADCAFYGLQVPDSVGGGETLEEIAARYLRALREVQPAGPYCLGGWSMGGVVAFEMARQLETSGETVDLVALIDSLAPPAAGEPRPEELAGGSLVALFAADLARLVHLPLPALPAGFGELPAESALAWLADQAEAAGRLPFGLGRAEIARRFAMFRANYQAVCRYEAKRCPAPLALFRAAEAPPGARPDLGWQRWAERPVEVREVPGDHYTLLFEPEVEILASQLRERLAARAEGIGYELCSD